jgi:hypothetical protein
VVISPEQLWRIWEAPAQPKVNSPEPTPHSEINSPELTAHSEINSPELAAHSEINSPEPTPQPKVNSPALTPQPKVNSPEPTRKRLPKGTRQPGRCDKGQANPSGRIELQVKRKKLSSGELKSYEYNLYRYQLGGVGKVYSKVIPLGKLEEVREAIAAGHPAEVIVKWFWGSKP